MKNFFNSWMICTFGTIVSIGIVLGVYRLYEIVSKIDIYLILGFFTSVLLIFLVGLFPTIILLIIKKIKKVFKNEISKI